MAGPSDETKPLRGFPGLVKLVIARNLSALGSQMLAVVFGWQIYALTHSAFALGLVGLVQFLPVLLLVFVAGHAVDRSDRKLIGAWCQALTSIGTVAVAIAAWQGAVTPELIYLLAALTATARAFENPALQALLPALVPAASFPRAAALSGSLRQVATIIGPSLGGLLYGFGAPAAYLACALAFLAGAMMSFSLPRSRPMAAPPPPSWAAFFGGVTFIRQRPEILGAISLDLFAVLLGGATALMPIYANDILHAGPIGLGLLRAAPAFGGLAVALHLARRPMLQRLGHKLFAAVALFGAATLVFGLSRTLPLSIVALAVLGGADVVSVMIRSTLVQLRTPDAMRGRVAAVNMLFIGSSNQLGEFESGTVAALVGPVPAVVIGGVGTLLVAGLWMAMFPGLRRMNRVDDETVPRLAD